MEEQSEILSLGTITTCSHESNRKRRKPESNRFKGVVMQPNGHWGAQIYAHDRIWLGTFKSQEEAAMAYDSAAIRLRSGDAHRNFPWTSISMEEPRFQSQFSTEALLGMIKDGSYPTRFTEYLRKQSELFQQVAPSVNTQLGWAPRKLFQKELTPSDVGKLNRLVIPKKFAMMHFPSVSRAILERKGGSGLDDEEMEFVDGSMRARWKFRYCYWKSSQSFVFTRGWNRFVKEKRLKAKDTVVFSLVEFKDASSSEIRSMLMIDAGYNIDDFEPKCDGEGDIHGVNDFVPKSVDLGDFEAKCVRDGDFFGVVEQSKALSKPSLRLFGVEIF